MTEDDDLRFSPRATGWIITTTGDGVEQFGPAQIVSQTDIRFVARYPNKRKVEFTKSTLREHGWGMARWTFDRPVLSDAMVLSPYALGRETYHYV